MTSREYLRPYQEAVEQHGPGFDATLWGSEETQKLRFDVLIELAGFEECTVVDAGCGQGDLCVYMLDRGLKFGHYIGLDAMAPMIDHAIKRGLDPEVAQFQTVDLVADPALLYSYRPDWVCFSGTLNTMDDATARSLISAAYDAAAQGVVFNFLSDRFDARWADRDLTPARRFETISWLDWAMGLTSRVSFTQDYLDGHDATIAMRH